MNELNKKFDLCQLNDRKLNQIAREASHLKPKIIDEIKECEWFLLNDKTYSFEPSKVNIEDIFGVFKSADRQVFILFTLSCLTIRKQEFFI